MYSFADKQTSYQFECSQLDEDGMPKPFHIKMLWEAIQLLQPTQEIIHMAWSFGLNYNIGTSEMGLNTMTIVAEQFGMKIDDMMRTPFENQHLSEICMPEADLRSVDRENQKQIAERAAAQKEDGEKAGSSSGAHIPCSQASNGEFTRMLSPENPTVSDQTLLDVKHRLSQKRKSLNKFRHNCVKTSQCARQLKDVRKMVDSVLSAHEVESDIDLTLRNIDNFDDLNEAAESMSPAKFGALLFRLDEEGMDVVEWLNDSNFTLQMAYMRARACKYPGSDNCIWSHHERHTIEGCPNCNPHFEEEQEEEDALALDDGHEPEPQNWLSLQCSTLLPDALDAALFYKPTSLVQWSCNLPAEIGYNEHSAETARLGIRRVANVSRRQKTIGSGGADVYDTAWLQLSGEQYKTWFRFARYVKERMNSTIANALDVHVDGLRDCLYLVSTRDNQRRCSEQPRVPFNKSQNQAFLDINGGKPTTKSTVIKVNTKPGEDIPKMPSRCAESKMKDTTLDRHVMGLFVEGKLPALDFYASNHIVMSPPIRMLETGIEANISALHSHVTLCAEAAVVCSQVPGIRNMQERFSHNTPGPEGLTSNQDIAVGKKRAHSSEEGNALPHFVAPLAPEMDRLWKELDPKPTWAWRDVCKEVYQGKEHMYKTILMETLKKATNAHHTLPFSYDLISIAISINMANMLYDDYSPEQIKEFNNSGFLVNPLTPDTLPHLSLRYVGYNEASRQTISIPMPTERNPEFPFIEAGDPSEIDSGVTQQHVSRILCREATPSDVRNFISSRQGATSMRGVTGDLFATSTWLKHAITSLQDRGIVVPESTPVRALMNANSLANCRLAEGASVRGITGFKELGLVSAKPGSYKSIEDNQMELAIQQHWSATQNKRRTSTFVVQDVPTFGSQDPMLAIIGSGFRDEMDLT